MYCCFCLSKCWFVIHALGGMAGSSWIRWQLVCKLRSLVGRCSSSVLCHSLVTLVVSLASFTLEDRSSDIENINSNGRCRTVTFLLAGVT